MIRVQVNIEKSVLPELAAHLETIPAKGRAEKIRILAMLGLLVLNGSRTAATGPALMEPQVCAPPLPSLPEQVPVPLVKQSMSSLRKQLT